MGIAVMLRLLADDKWIQKILKKKNFLQFSLLKIFLLITVQVITFIIKQETIFRVPGLNKSISMLLLCPIWSESAVPPTSTNSFNSWNDNNRCRLFNNTVLTVSLYNISFPKKEYQNRHVQKPCPFHSAMQFAWWLSW